MITVVLVEPEHSGNIGRVARAMKNFSLEKLVLVNPKANHLDIEAVKYAKHARDVLEKARTVKGFEEICEMFDFLVGTTGVIGDVHGLRRKFITPKMLSEKIRDVEGEIALLFGRESIGLKPEELEACDVIVHIPTSQAYPVMNVAQAACIIFYEIFQAVGKKRLPKEVSGKEKRALIRIFSELVDTLGMRNPKKAKLAFRRVIGSAFITKRECSTLSGVFRLALDRIRPLRRLVRDGYEARERAREEEFLHLLKLKLLEEANRFFKSESKEELADMLEVMLTIVREKGWSWEEIERIRRERLERLGGFEERKVLRVELMR